MLKTHVTTLIDAVDATTTSKSIYIGDAKRVGILMRRADDAGGSSTFTFLLGGEDENTVTPTMTATNMMIKDIAADAGAGTASEDIGHTRVAAIAISATDGDETCWLDSEVIATWIAVKVTEDTDGTHSAFLLVEKED